MKEKMRLLQIEQSVLKIESLHLVEDSIDEKIKRLQLQKEAVSLKIRRLEIHKGKLEVKKY